MSEEGYKNVNSGDFGESDDADLGSSASSWNL